MIPEGGGTELFCQYSDPGGIPRVVGWFRDSTMIVGDGMQEQCDCASVESGRASNLTFSNFMSERSADEYGCWATTPDGFDGCNFNVVVAGKVPQVYFIISKLHDPIMPCCKSCMASNTLLAPCIVVLSIWS